MMRIQRRYFNCILKFDYVKEVILKFFRSVVVDTFLSIYNVYVILDTILCHE